MNLKMIKTYKGALDRTKSNSTFSQEKVEKATINVNKKIEDFALDNLFDEGISSNANDALNNEDISAKNNYGNVSMSSVQDYQNKIDECDVLLKEKEQELQKYNSWSGVGANPNASKVREVKNDIATLKSTIHSLENQKKSLEHVNLLNTEEIKNYQSKSSGNADDVKMSLVGTTTYLVKYDEKSGMNKAEFMKIALEKYGGYDFNVVGIDGDEKDKLESLVEASKINPNYLNLYNWYYDNKGEEAASKYLDDMYEVFNQEVGQQRAKEFLSTLKDDKNIGNVVMNHLGINGKGLDDGLKSFEDGLLSWFNDSDVYSSSDYEKMYILQELSKKKNGYSVNYEVSQGIGNMLPSIFISCVPIVGQSAGTFTLGASAGGSSYHEALVSGYSKDQAVMYGLLAGSSEALLQRFLGGIPGLSDVNVTNFSTYLKAMAKEGVEEGAQQVFDSTVLRTNILGEDVDFDQLVKDVGKSAAYGALTAGILNGGVVAINGVNSVNTNVGTNTNTNTNANTNTNTDTIINSSDSDTNSSARGVLLNQASDALKRRQEFINERSKISSEMADSSSKSTIINAENSINDVSLENNEIEDTGKLRFDSLLKAKGINLFGDSSNKIGNLTKEQINWINKINNMLKDNEIVSINLKNTKSITSDMLKNISDLSRVSIRMDLSLSDFYGNYMSKYEKSKYIERVTYSGTEAYSILKRIEELESKVDMNLPITQRAKQIYDIISSEVPVMWNRPTRSHWVVSQSLRGIVSNNIVGEEGLVCAGYSALFRELCTRCDIQCDYIRGRAGLDLLTGRGGGHAWNVFIDENNNPIPVDVTWKVSSGDDWFGGSQKFQETHIPDADEMFKNYMIPANIVKNSKNDMLDTIVSTMDQYYGEGSGIKSLKDYVNTGNSLKITRQNGARSLLQYLDKDDIITYINEKSSNITQPLADNDKIIENILTTMINTYGEGYGFKSLQEYVKTGNKNSITRKNGARDSLQYISKNEISEYLNIKINTIQNIISTMDQYYGTGAGVDSLRNYIKSGNKNSITRKNGARESLQNLTLMEIKEYLSLTN